MRNELKRAKWMGKIIQRVLKYSFVKGPSRIVEFVLLMLADITIVEHLIDFTSGVQANF